MRCERRVRGASSFETHRFAMLLRIRSWTLMVRSASSRVSNHEATGKIAYRNGIGGRITGPSSDGTLASGSGAGCDATGCDIRGCDIAGGGSGGGTA
jgi:hypothetical protein